MIAFLCALPLITASALSPTIQDGEAVPPIQDTGDSYILNFSAAEEAMTLERFVAACQESTGRNFTYKEDTAAQLKQAKIRLYGVKEIPKEDFYNFFQIMMIINDFVCSRIGPSHLEVIMIQSMQGNRVNLRQDALFVLPEDLQEFADQPATLIHTVLNLPNTDVRTLTNSMRAMLTDANTQQIIPVGNSNSLILTGFGSQVAALARMLLLVDEASQEEEPIVPEFEVIPLEFAAADEIADTIEELLEAGRRAGSGNNRGGQNQAQGVTGAIRQNQSETRIMVDPRTNSLLVMAMPADMPQIKELVASLDVDIIERERNYHIYSLDNVDAEELADVLEDFVRDAARITPSGGGGGQQNQQNQTQNDVVVVPDTGTNSILIAANRTRYEEVLDLIRRLDRRQDQVLIETALIELTGQNTIDIGVEFGLADIPGVGQAGGFGVTNFGLSQFMDTDGDGIPDTRVPNNGTGFSAGFLDGDDFSLPILISALQTRRDTNVLNIPSILVNNNSSATIRSLDEQPTTQITQTGVNGGTQENFNEYQEAGITLTISPTISASRYLRLSVFLEVSSFLGSFQGAIPPPRITRTIDTVVNVPDGDTMVIGGIIVDDANKTRNAIPFLGDIPLLGFLFRRDTDTENRTTLYFFVTPHIMRDAEFADLAEWTYRKKTEAADAIGVGRVQIVDPNFGRTKNDLDLSSFDVPLYQSAEAGEVEGEEVGLNNAEINEMLENSDNQ